ncbi:outer membrane beta-barrel protein [Vibrio sp. SCSIO 43135]|uniref:outer membrane protein n=1 Tax=Vibrio sp. SCSIO 43135 TaxID=2819096 RepID=UPI0020763AEB|nr:outer membrane beta-barrel protein [Vibrio sp. SCSIO 43135]USD41983.1 outer membrane beta-barrel protein [Vibrio sp. SCSIO 43135]
MKPIIASLLFTSAIISQSTQADIYITPWVGYTLGGEVVDQDDNEYDLKASESFALAVEATLEQGRIGLYYATQNSSIDQVNEDSAIHYLHLQSSIYYPVEKNFSTYVGVGLGGSYTDVDWADDKYGFSASLFGGMEYNLSDNMAINGQLRWLGTVVDNETTSVCNLPSSEACTIRFKTDWMNQFSANIGLVISF